MGIIRSRLFVLVPAIGLAIVFLAETAVAAGRSEPWQMWFQPAASPVMERIIEFHNFIFIIEVLIVVLVLVLMGYIIIRFNAKSNPVPSKTTHNTILEVAWTAVPLLLVIIIAVPSLKLLYYADRIEEGEMTLKVIGNQWYWSYEYPDHGAFAFDSIIIEDENLEPGQPRLLSVDNSVVLPAETNIRLLFTSADVIHNWAVPSLGLKLDAVPGRVNESWVRINSEGDYYGMCSELCGVNHGFMPVHIKAVSKADFAAWVEQAKQEFAGENSNAGVRVAKADTRVR
ncbi:MAG: cytochrome c oxidase subunit 2 [Alphaproteobacteria bacterium MarineAlpha3_Bin4]|nr:MAG: cytochrome c oxidase subunit 2 [Alphaproteobacteria bacterium MarineAlpha3_Bin4]